MGRRVVKLRCVPKVLAPDDPDNPFDRPFETFGFHQSSPLRGDEVVLRRRSGLPLTAELVEWCRQDAIICLAGPIAEGILGEPGSQHDIDEWHKSASALGQIGSREETLFYEATIYAAETIIVELGAHLEELIVRLTARGEMQELEIDEALVGTPNGSHKHLLKTLPDGFRRAW